MSTINLKLKSYDELIFEITTLNTNNYLLEQKVEQLKKENKELNRMCEIYSQSLYNADLKKAEQEIDRLNNIINELEKEIISQIEICKEGQVLETISRSPFDTYSSDIRAYKYLLYKLKELKEE